MSIFLYIYVYFSPYLSIYLSDGLALYSWNFLHAKRKNPTTSQLELNPQCCIFFFFFFLSITSLIFACSRTTKIKQSLEKLYETSPRYAFRLRKFIIEPRSAMLFWSQKETAKSSTNLSPTK